MSQTIIFKNVGKMIRAGFAAETKQRTYMLVRDSRDIIIDTDSLHATQGPWEYQMHHPTPEEAKALLAYIAPPPDATDTMLALAKGMAGTDPPEDKSFWHNFFLGALFGEWLSKK